jgi:16S rRNA G966 N2-methylase RsmD
VNLLYYGDNLKVLREHVKDESVDLVYLDPPFHERCHEIWLEEIGKLR